MHSRAAPAVHLSFNEPPSRTISVKSRLEAPVSVLARLENERFSGQLTLALAAGEVRVWLQAGRVAWAERPAPLRSLGGVLRELLPNRGAGLRELVRSAQARGLSVAEALLSVPGMSESKLRGALQEHLLDALSDLTVSAPCRCRRIAADSSSPTYGAQWTFALAEVLLLPGGSSDARESLQQLTRRVYGARAVDLVCAGSAAGLTEENAADKQLLEAADELLLRHDDGAELAVLQASSGTWAGLRSATDSDETHTWVSFAPEVGLGGTYLGLQALRPRDSLRTRPILPSLNGAPSLFPRADDAVAHRSLLASALELADGALAAHVVERDVVSWGVHSVVSPLRRASDEILLRAASLLELLPAADARASTDQLDGFVMLERSDGFHIGTRIAGADRVFLFLTFAAGASYGHAVAALTRGAAALATARDSSTAR